MTKHELEKIIKITAQTTIEESIRKGVYKCEFATPYQKTERLLYAYNALKIKISDLNLDIKELKKGNLPSRSKDIVFASRGGAVDKEEIRQALIADKEAELNRNIIQVKKLKKALKQFENDCYYKIIELKYFKQKKDDEIADILNCDKSTVNRNKKRLIQALSVVLFGVDAI